MAIELNDVKSGYSTPLINDNFQRLEDELNDNVLRRDGLSPGEANQMNVPLDMNSNPILNASTDPDDPNSLVTRQFADLRYVNRSGDTMQGSLSMAGNNLSNIGTASTEKLFIGGYPIKPDTGLTSPYIIYTDTIGELQSINESELLEGQQASVKNRGSFVYVGGTWVHQGTDKGPSQVDRLLSSTTVRGMYVYWASDSSVRVGYSFPGEGSPVSEYKIRADGEGWYRLYGAKTGFVTDSVSSTPLQTNPNLDGSFTFGSTASTYTTTVGDKLSSYYTGKSLSFRSFTDNRGGVWRFKINGGNPVSISTYSSSSTTSSQVVYENLDPNKVYFVEAEFIGDDPLNPPSGGVSHGWVYYLDPVAGGDYPDGRRAFGNKFEDQIRVLGQSLPPREVISENGINEFAFKVQKVGSSLDDVWVPYHGGESMLESLETTMLVDGQVVEPSSLPGFTPVRECSSVKFVQRFLFKQPGEVGTLGFLTSIHQFNSDGTLDFSWAVKATQQFQINTWYAYQFMSNRDHCRNLYLNDDTLIRVFDFDDSGNFSYNNLNVDSVAFVGISSSSRNVHHGAAMDVNFRSAYAQNKKADDASSQLLITSRPNDVVKIYWRTGSGYIMEPNEIFQASFRVCAVTGILGPNSLSNPALGNIFG